MQECAKFAHARFDYALAPVPVSQVVRHCAVNPTDMIRHVAKPCRAWCCVQDIGVLIREMTAEFGRVSGNVQPRTSPQDVLGLVNVP